MNCLWCGETAPDDGAELCRACRGTDRGRKAMESGHPLPALAGLILTCTGLAAVWCPIHGNCRCPDRENALDDPNCPLHSPRSDHAN